MSRGPLRILRSACVVASKPFLTAVGLARSGFLAAATRARILVGAYYWIGSSRFRREQVAFLAGLRQYREEVRSARSSRALLRRNIHRLEKGLSLRPRKAVFALDYIEETVDAYSRRLRHPGEAPEEVAWGAAVLGAYFDAVSIEHPVVTRLRARFEAMKPGAPCGFQDRPSSPYRRDLSKPSPVKYEALHQLSLRRRSVRGFLPLPVPRILLNKAMLVALQSPSACNRQPFRFHCFDEAEWIRRVSAIPMGTEGYSHEIPAIIVVVGQMRNFFEERDRHLIYIDGSLAAMSFMLAAETLGLSTCPINWPDMEDKELQMARLIGLVPDERPVMLIAVGFPDPEALVPGSVKRTPGEILRFNLE